MRARKASVCARAFATEKPPTVRETLVDDGGGEKGVIPGKYLNNHFQLHRDLNVYFKQTV